MEKNGIDKTFSKPDRGKAARNDATGESRSPPSAPGGVPASRGADVRGAPGSGSPGRQADPRRVEGLLRKYTNLVQGWQHRYFVLDTDCGQLHYFISEPGEGQRPRGSLLLPGATVRPSEEAPHTFTVLSAAGEFYRLRAANAREQHFWMNHLLASTRWHSNGSTEVGKWKHPVEHSYVERTHIGQDGQGSSSPGWPGSLTLLTAGSPPPGILRPPSASAVSRGIVTIIHNKSPDSRNRYSRRLQEVQEVMNQAEGKQKSLVHCIESLPTCGPVSCLDQDLLLLKATSTATLDCLGECLSILQQRASQAGPPGPPSLGGAPPTPGHAPPTPGHAPPFGESVPDALLSGPLSFEATSLASSDPSDGHLEINFPLQPELVKVTVQISHPIISFCLQNGPVRLISRPTGACLLFRKSSSVKSLVLVQDFEISYQVVYIVSDEERLIDTPDFH